MRETIFLILAIWLTSCEKDFSTEPLFGVGVYYPVVYSVSTEADSVEVWYTPDRPGRDSTEVMHVDSLTFHGIFDAGDTVRMHVKAYSQSDTLITRIAIFRYWTADSLTQVASTMDSGLVVKLNLESVMPE